MLRAQATHVSETFDDLSRRQLLIYAGSWAGAIGKIGTSDTHSLSASNRSER